MPVMGEKGKVKEPEREPSNGEKGEKTQQRNLAREKAPTRGRDLTICFSILVFIYSCFLPVSVCKLKILYIFKQ